MPPRKFSRHSYCLGFKDLLGPEEDAGKFQLTEREPFVFKTFSDNRVHVVAEGDTLVNLASRYFFGVDNASSLWWIIADFQQDPILDPTLKLRIGSQLIIPSVRTVLESIFTERRRVDHGQ